MRNVAVLLPATVRSFELAVFAEVFGRPPTIDYAVASEHPGVPVPAPGGLAVTPAAGLERLAVADLIALVPPAGAVREVSPAVSEALHAAVARGARVVAVCSAAFTLAATGLLDGRTIAVHSSCAGRLTDWFPAVRADTSVLYRDDDPFFTSAGSGAALDLCLHVLAKDHGAAAAAEVGRGMLVAPHRMPWLRTRSDAGIGRLLEWAIGNLHEDLSIDVMARQALLSRRSLARRFREATGTTPYAWVLEQRVRLAQQLLERDPDLGVEDAAARAGFSSAALLRQHFQRRFGCSPTEYRARFAPSSR
ncbi:helix-turn-helix domain-containing protein [Actinoplanes sp. NPDC051411]|uniref:GlxA family transcriptional regulator n=1 Tax=Actinoplanes sp. NPDC051411 TaxID=3155522 RepID=UPI00343A7478